jgi:catechol 2,3-dioxygenase-like lactoylglutathione lyase family enzyme
MTLATTATARAGSGGIGRHRRAARRRRAESDGRTGGCQVIDHVAYGVRDFPACKAFYEQALRPLGYELIMEYEGVAGFGANGKPDLWIHANRPPAGSLHVAIASPDRATVRAFHAAGLAAGGTDNGAPGPRPQYHATYYGAFVLDPDGNNIEAVCHRPE